MPREMSYHSEEYLEIVENQSPPLILSHKFPEVLHLDSLAP
jgi:hypothetical protein